MKAARKRTQSSAPAKGNELLWLELRIAKRADRLWRLAGYCSGRDLVHWQQAESEILSRYFGSERPVAEMAAADC